MYFLQIVLLKWKRIEVFVMSQNRPRLFKIRFSESTEKFDTFSNKRENGLIVSDSSQRSSNIQLGEQEQNQFQLDFKGISTIFINFKSCNQLIIQH